MRTTNVARLFNSNDGKNIRFAPGIESSLKKEVGSGDLVEKDGC